MNTSVSRGFVHGAQALLTGLVLTASLGSQMGCGADRGKQTTPARAEKRYPVRGEVLGLDPQNRVATIKHEEIPGWMEAMTMDFPIRDAAEFNKLSVGDRIEATVFVEEVGFALGEIRVVGKGGPAPAAKD